MRNYTNFVRANAFINVAVADIDGNMHRLSKGVPLVDGRSEVETALLSCTQEQLDNLVASGRIKLTFGYPKEDSGPVKL